MSCRNYFISMLCLSILSCSTENSTDTLSAIQVRTHMDETSSIATEKDLDEPIGIYLKESADAESLIDGVAFSDPIILPKYARSTRRSRKRWYASTLTTYHAARLSMPN